MYTHSLYVLTHSAMTVEQVIGQLQRLRLGQRIEPPRREHWSRMGYGLTVHNPGEDVARLFIDVIPAPWPSGQALSAERALSVAFRMGHFGFMVKPESYHLALARADVSEQAEFLTHQAMVRLRLSLVEDHEHPWDVAAEKRLEALAQMHRCANFLLEHELALGLFSPSSRTLWTPRSAWRLFDSAMGDKQHLWPLWASCQVTATNDQNHILESYGLGRLGLPEVVIDCRSEDALQLEPFYRQFVLTRLQQGPGVQVDLVTTTHRLERIDDSTRDSNPERYTLSKINS